MVAGVKPLATQTVTFDPAQRQVEVPLPADFAQRQVIVKVEAGGINRSGIRYASNLVAQLVERYGQGLFTQHLLAPSSLRGILRGGVRNWLEQLVDRDIDSGEPAPPAARHPRRLIEDLASGALPMKQAATRLRLVLESIAENHAEYRDWNSTTTQSDRGECLHILLDYLRVKAEHDRIAWTLRPVGMAHRVLARRGAGDAAEAWRARLRDETRDSKFDPRPRPALRADLEREYYFEVLACSAKADRVHGVGLV